MDNFSHRLIQVRKGLHLTQEELGNYLGVTKATISNYEKGLRTPDLDFFINYIEFCRKEGIAFSYDYLLGLSTNNQEQEFKTSLLDKFNDSAICNLTYISSLKSHNEIIGSTKFKTLIELISLYTTKSLDSFHSTKFYRELFAKCDSITYNPDYTDKKLFKLIITDIVEELLDESQKSYIAMGIDKKNE